MMRHLMAMATYAIILLAILLIQKFGFGTIDPQLWKFLLLLGIVGNAIFFLIIYSGINLRFPDPSLTWLQISYAGFVVVFILYALPTMRPVVLLFFIPAFSFGMLRLNRRAYLSLVCWVMGWYAMLLMIEFWQQRPDYQIKYEIFLFTIFGIVLTWFAFFGGFMSSIRRRLHIQNKTIQRAHDEIRLEIEERKRIQREKDQLIIELRAALSKVKVLSGLLPICSECKKIRDDTGYWNQLEAYIGKHSNAEFTHGICPDCARQALLDMAKYLPTE